ncbi:MAG TPA: hypothetical protein VL943_08135, partial [Niabella sp.]|nr:hypothetical protein [Niabella sp.]
MSNKLYFIGQSLENISLKELRDDFVMFTSRKIVEAIQTDPSERNTWLLKHFQQSGMDEGDPVQQSCWGDINTTAQIDMKQPQSMAEQLEFIHSLPVKERVVQYSSDYIYSSSRDYVGMPGLVKIT